MDSQNFLSAVERHFQKSEYIAIKHQSFKMVTAPKNLRLENAHLYTFLSNGQDVSEKLFSSLADYAKSAAFYNKSSNGERLYVLCVFSKNSFSDKERELFDKVRKFSSVSLIPAGHISGEGCAVFPKKPPVFASNELKKVLQYSQSILKLSRFTEN